MTAVYSDVFDLNVLQMKWAQWDKTQSRELLALFTCVCIVLSTIVVHNIAQNRPDNFSSYPPDNHHCSDDVYSREGANLRSRSETCCTWLAENAGRKVAKNRHLGTIAQLCRRGYIFAIKARIDNRKKNFKQQYLLHMSPQYGALRSTSCWDRSGSLRHPT